MGIIGWIVLGLLAGAIAKILLPGRDPGGLIGTTLIGIAGAFIGGWLSAKFLHKPISNHFFDAATWGVGDRGLTGPADRLPHPLREFTRLRRRLRHQPRRHRMSTAAFQFTTA
ncbi:hypothetical protein GCM10020000_07490 [Streptomyces olivoverticillatus]